MMPHPLKQVPQEEHSLPLAQLTESREEHSAIVMHSQHWMQADLLHMQDIEILEMNQKIHAESLSCL